MTLARRVARCPAKINLALRVLGRRPDGYHELDTVFQVVDLWDTLEVEAAETLVLSTDHPTLAIDETNLVLRAARALREAFAVEQGARIHLTKCIPLAAGLGGGSSDAATTLVALNELWQLGRSHAELAALGADLGADVPVFVHGRAAFAEG